MKKIVFILVLLIAFLAFNLEVRAATYQITFEWNHSTSADRAGYRLYMSAASGQYSYGAANALASYGLVETGQASVVLNEGERRYFVMTCFDAAGNESGPSNEVGWTAPDVTPPDPPGNFLLKLWAKLMAWIKAQTVRF